MYKHGIKLAKQTYFLDLISNNKNKPYILFTMMDQLLNPLPSVDSDLLCDSKCNAFAASFKDKITNVRSETVSRHTIHITELKILFSSV